MTDKSILEMSITEISEMPAFEEQNKNRAHAIQLEQKRAMRPIQKVLRAA